MNIESVIAIIVTFNPPGDIRQRIMAVANDVGQIVVIDNASDAPVRKALENIQKELPARLECVWNEKNEGLAAALNQGIVYALKKGADWVLLLDHDSWPQPGMIAAMSRAYGAWPRQNQIALIAPNIRDENVASATRYLVPWRKFGFRRVVPNKAVMDKVLTVITSGSLVKAATFREIGLMTEAFFIDYVDHDFCLRLKTRGFNILLVKDAVLNHRLGEKTAHHLAGTTFVIANHSSLRRYYIFRNRLWIWRRYGRCFPGFVLHDCLASIFDILRIIASEQQKISKLKAIGRGVVAGLSRIDKQ